MDTKEKPFSLSFAQEEKISQHHEAFNVVGIGGLKEAPDHCVQGQNPGGAVIKPRGERPAVAEEVGGPLAFPG